MKIYGLIGYPLSHSFSQLYFNQKFNKENIPDCRFELFAIEQVEQFPLLLRKNSDICGLAVTIPYKEAIIPYLSELDFIAKEIRAVNCITISENGLKGYNTDVIGFEKSIAPMINSQHQKALILGSGGSSKAVGFVLNKLGIDFLRVSRKKTNLSNCINYDNIDREIMHQYKLVINCSPVGQYPDINDYPKIPYQFVTSEHLFFDLIYNPEKSEFLKRAASKGATIKNGREMLEIQAEENWKLWNQNLG